MKLSKFKSKKKAFKEISWDNTDTKSEEDDQHKVENFCLTANESEEIVYDKKLSLAS